MTIPWRRFFDSSGYLVHLLFGHLLLYLLLLEWIFYLEFFRGLVLFILEKIPSFILSHVFSYCMIWLELFLGCTCASMYWFILPGTSFRMKLVGSNFKGISCHAILDTF